MPTASLTCPLCEAGCGLAVTVEEDGSVLEIRGDRDDVASRGYICPKGVAVKGLHEDPDRVRTPMLRKDGLLREASWGEAFAEIERRLPAIQAEHGPDAVALYAGDPTTRTLGQLLYLPALADALDSRNIYSAASLNTWPRQAACGLMYGDPYRVPIPDLDGTRFLLILGANPVVSHGSMLTAPDLRARLRALRRRGGRVVVVDPRRSVSAEGADEHLRIRPGTDALLLLAMAHVLFADGRVRLGAAEGMVNGVAEVAELAAPFTPEQVARRTEIDADTIRRLTRELAAADGAAVYAGKGIRTGAFATATSWLVDVVNVLTGNLDRPGGVMFPLPGHAGRPVSRRPSSTAFNLEGPRSRVRGLPAMGGELPAAALAEEIDTPGRGQVRALITVAGNPARSVPASARMRAALDSLELLVCVDFYLNETSGLADVVLPAPSILESPHYPLLLSSYACHNSARYSPPALPLPLGMSPDWETLLRLALIAAGGRRATAGDVAGLDDRLAAELAAAEGVDPSEVPADLRGPERMLDILLRAGEYGLTLEHLQLSPHGLDLGPLEPRLPEALATADRRVHLAPPECLAEGERLVAALSAPASEGFLLVGRGHLRSTNSWLHNLPAMVAGARRCTLHVNPDDAFRLGLRDGGRALVASRSGQLVAAVEVTDEVTPGVVSLPHGWGHDEPHARLRVAAGRPGVNANLLTDEAEVDTVTGSAVFNGVRVQVLAHAGDAAPADQPTPDRRSGLDRRRTPRGPGGIGPESFGPA